MEAILSFKKAAFVLILFPMQTARSTVALVGTKHALQCAFAVVLLSIGLTSCFGPALSPVNPAEYLAKDPIATTKVKEFESLPSFRNNPSNIRWYYEGPSNKRYILETVFLEQEDDAILFLHQVTVDGKRGQSWEISRCRYFSNILAMGNHRFRFFGGNHTLNNKGDISVRYKILEIDLSGDYPTIDERENSDFILDTGIIRENTLYRGSDASKIRLEPELNEYYRQFFINPRYTEATFFSDVSRGDTLFWSLLAESGSFNIRDRIFTPVQNYLEFNYLQCKWRAAQPIDQSQPIYMVLLEPKELSRHCWPTGQALQVEPILEKSLLIAKEIEGRLVVSSPPIHPKMPVNHLKAVYQSSHGLYLLGSQGHEAEHTDKTTLWVGHIVDGHLNEKTFNITQNVSPSVLWVNSKTGEIFVGGNADYSQAKTGSVGHTKAFVLWLADDLTEKGRHLLSGPGSTHILHLSIESSGRLLVTTGLTNASSTHDIRTSKSFIQTLSLDEIKGDKK